jgi:hypothetical protein
MRKLVTAAALAVVLSAMVIAGANVRGWRALVTARLFRVDNDPVASTDVFADGLTQPFGIAFRDTCATARAHL